MLKNFPIMLALCFMLSSLYYAENYARIIDTSLLKINEDLNNVLENLMLKLKVCVEALFHQK